MIEFVDDIRDFRNGLHKQAYARNRDGQSQVAQTLWTVVEELDRMLNRLDERRADSCG